MDKFTDDDLKRLKEFTERHKLQPEYTVHTANGVMEALLARLQLAENVVNGERCEACPDRGWSGVESIADGECHQVQCQFCYENPKSVFNAIEAWRKAAGR